MARNFLGIRNTLNSTSSEVINNIESISNIKTKEPSLVSIDFRYYIYRPFKFRGFTNFLKMEDNYTKTHEALFRAFIPYYTNKNINEMLGESKHNHYIKDDEEKKLNEILKSCYDNGLISKDIVDMEDKRYYQLYMQSGMRIIGLLYGTTFFVLFPDPHHLIYRNENFDEDYKNYKYEPKLVSEEKVVIFDEVEIEHCYDCEHMKKYLES